MIYDMTVRICGKTLSSHKNACGVSIGMSELNYTRLIFVDHPEVKCSPLL